VSEDGAIVSESKPSRAPLETMTVRYDPAVGGKMSSYRYRRVCTGINILSWNKRFYTGTKAFTPV
jgi:hypothetical protein